MWDHSSPIVDRFSTADLRSCPPAQSGVRVRVHVLLFHAPIIQARIRNIRSATSKAKEILLAAGKNVQDVYF